MANSVFTNLHVDLRLQLYPVVDTPALAEPPGAGTAATRPPLEGVWLAQSAAGVGHQGVVCAAAAGAVAIIQQRARERSCINIFFKSAMG